MLTKFDTAVIITAGRTGSQLIERNLRDYFKCPTVHTHNPLPTLGTNHLVILSRRYEVFDSILSTIIGQRSHEFNFYTNKFIQPFIVDQQEFEHCFWFFRCHNHVVTTKYVDTITIWFDKLIDDPKYLFNQFGIDRDTNYYFSKSPYRPEQLILNLSQCKEWFDSLSQLPLLTELVESFEKSIQNEWLPK